MNREALIRLGMLALFCSPYALTADNGQSNTNVNRANSAGIVNRQIQREYNLQNLSPTQDIPILEVDIPSEVLNIPDGVSIFIDQIVVNRTFPLFEKEIQEVSSRYAHRDLKGRDIVALCYEIQKLYADQGFILAWVYPPVQRINNKTLNITVVEGTLNHVEVQGNVSYKTRFIERYFKHLEGEPVNYNELTKALMLLNENSNLQAQAILKKGEAIGTVDLVLQVQDSRPLTLNAGYNNWGSTSTTYSQLSSSFNAGNLATSGDSFALQASCGLPFVFYYVNPTYTIPLTGSGANLNLSYSFNASDSQSPGSEGQTSWTEIATITYNQPLARTRRFQAGVNAGFSFQQYKNLDYGATSSYDRLRVVSFGGTVNYVDSLQGRNVITPTLNIGIPNFLGGSPVYDDLCSRPGGGGRYWILTLNGQRVQSLLTDCMFVITASAQGTFNKIPESVQYFLGGVGTVRGYVSAVAVGDVGYCANFEFYLPPPFLKNKTFKPMKQTWGNIMQLLAFIDHGGIYTVAPVDGELSSAYLTSVGAGLRFYGPRSFTLSFDAGFPVMQQYKDYNSIFYIRFNMDFL